MGWANVEFRQNSEFDPPWPWYYWNKPVLLVLFIYPACDGHEKVYAMHCCTTYTTPKPIYKCIHTLSPQSHILCLRFQVLLCDVMCMYHDSFFTPLKSTVEFELSEVVECLWGNFIESFTMLRYSPSAAS